MIEASISEFTYIANEEHYSKVFERISNIGVKFRKFLHFTDAFARNEQNLCALNFKTLSKNYLL